MAGRCNITSDLFEIQAKLLVDEGGQEQAWSPGEWSFRGGLEDVSMTPYQQFAALLLRVCGHADLKREEVADLANRIERQAWKRPYLVPREVFDLDTLTMPRLRFRS